MSEALKEARKRKVTHEQAREAWKKLHDALYNRGRVPTLSVPPRPEDVDLVLTDYISQQEASEAALSRSAEPTKHEQVCEMLGEMALAKPDMRLEAAASVLLGILLPPTEADIKRGQELQAELNSRSAPAPEGGDATTLPQPGNTPLAGQAGNYVYSSVVNEKLPAPEGMVADVENILAQHHKWVTVDDLSHEEVQSKLRELLAQSSVRGADFWQSEYVRQSKEILQLAGMPDDFKTVGVDHAIESLRKRLVEHPTSESGTKSCLMCGQIGDKAIVHEPSGVYICMNCRAKAESGRVEEQDWVEWVEPFGVKDEPVYMRVTKQVAIEKQKQHAANMRKGFVYENDQQALDDFMAVHWASHSQPSVKEK